VLVIVAAAISMFGPNAFDLHPENWSLRKRWTVALAATAGACLALMAGGGPSPFLYFQF